MAEVLLEVHHREVLALEVLDPKALARANVHLHLKKEKIRKLGNTILKKNQ